MTNNTLPTPEPTVTPDTEEFWAGTAEGRLLLPRCTTCSTVIWYPRHFCPECWGVEVDWIEASGKGSVYSFSINRKGFDDYADAAPYVLAYVELEEGPRVLTNIVGDPESVRIGAAVRAVFHPTAQGRALVRFELAP